MPVAFHFHHFLGTWQPLADWAVALGTGGLAYATFRLANRAQSEAEAVVQQAQVERDALLASTRPVVVPIRHATAGDRTRFGLALKNFGTGPALNIHGVLTWNERDIQLAPLAVLGRDAATDDDVLLEGDWRGAHAAFDWRDAKGSLVYQDIARHTWRTVFLFDADGNLDVLAAKEVTDITELPYGEAPRGVVRRTWQA